MQPPLQPESEQPTEPQPTPATPPPLQPQPQPTGIIIAGRRFTLPWAIGGVIALLAVLTCGCCGTVAIASQLGGNNSAVLRATATTRATQAPKATATTTPDTRASDYRTFVTLESTIIETDFNAFADHCNSTSTLSDCRTAVQTAHDDIVDYLNGLATHPAPPCLSTADTSLRSALTSYQQGTQFMLDGLDQTDANKINQGSALVSKGTDEIQHTAADIHAATC